MENAPGWHRDPERDDQERYWTGSAWTGRVRPAGNAGSPHLPEHVPQLHRALAAATADIESVEDRLSALFDRTEGNPHLHSSPASASASERDPDDEIIELFEECNVVEEEEIDEEFADAPGRDGDDDDDEKAAFVELDAALAAEEPEGSTSGFFRRRS